MKLSHVGIAVLDLHQALEDYTKLLGYEKSHDEVLVETEHVRVAMLKLGNAELELLSPTADGPIAKFLREKGEGMHHVAFEVDDVQKAIVDAERNGYRLVDKVPRKGAWGAEAAFVHPKSAHGVLIEYYKKKSNTKP
jgi:methylmalonyl-CoA epimerase